MADVDKMRTITPDEVWETEFSKLPWRRTRQIRELAAPLGGLGVRITGNILQGLFDPTEVFNIPTRSRLARRAAEVQFDNGVRALAEEQEIDDPELAEKIYGLGRVMGDIAVDGSFIERQPPLQLSPEAVEQLRESYRGFTDRQI